MNEREIALQLAMKQLGFYDYDEYYYLVARCTEETKKSHEFKEWECVDGSKLGLASVLYDKQAVLVCSSYGCEFNLKSVCTNTTFETEHNIPCNTAIN